MGDAVNENLLASSILQHAQDAIIAKDLDGRIISWNDGAAALYGYSRDEVLGKPMSILGLTGKWFEVLAVIRQVTSGRRLPHYETTRVRKGGTEVRVSVMVSPIKDAQGNVVGVVTIDRDVSALPQAAGHDPEPPQDPSSIVIDKDLNGNIRFWSEGAARLYGYSPDEVVGKPVSLLIPPDRVSEMDDLIEAARDGGSVHGIHTMRVTRDGRRVEVLLDVVPIHDRLGQLVGVRSVAVPLPQSQALPPVSGEGPQPHD